MRPPLILLLAGYAVCALFGLVHDLRSAHCPRHLRDTGVRARSHLGTLDSSVTLAVLFTGIYLVRGRGRNGPGKS